MKTIVFGVVFAFAFGVCDKEHLNCNQLKNDTFRDNDINLVLKNPKEKAHNNFDLKIEDIFSSRILPTRSDTPGYIYTPNGSLVLIYTRSELTPEQIEDYNDYGDTLVPEATRIAPSTKKYNCHSYGWYMQSTLNPYWMDDPADYYTDGSYEVSTGEIGDIICYFDDCDCNLHSGIVIGTLEGTSNGVCGDADLKIIRSKWGSCGLYEHRGDQCPYTSSYYGDAEYVMYFKPRVVETITLSNPNSNTTLNINRSYNVPINSTILNNYALYGLNVNSRKTYGFEILSSNELDVRFYDEHMHIINFNMTNSYENEIYSISFSRFLNLGKYYLRVSFDDNSDTGEICTKIINAHNHSYDSSYLWWDLTQHQSTCGCGSTQLEPHVVPAGSYNFGDQTATCILCNGPASFGMWPAASTNYPITSNGSFILPNGVVVLVDEDFDAYMDGTLVFVYPNIE